MTEYKVHPIYRKQPRAALDILYIDFWKFLEENDPDKKQNVNLNLQWLNTIEQANIL